MTQSQNSTNFLISKAIAHPELREIQSLKYRKNARSHSSEQIALIAKSLQEFGWTTPVLIDLESVLLAGYGRVEAAKLLGMESVPVIVASGWSEAQKRAYMLADNQIALSAGWDEEILAIELSELKLMDFDLSVIGFDGLELDSIRDHGTLTRPIGNLRDQFILPPFSVLDTRQAWWQERRRGWLALGIQSELGRGTNALRYSDTILQPDPKKRKRAAAAKMSHRESGNGVEQL